MYRYLSEAGLGCDILIGNSQIGSKNKEDRGRDIAKVIHFFKGVAQGRTRREGALTASSCNQAGNRIDCAGQALRDSFLVPGIKFK